MQEWHRTVSDVEAQPASFRAGIPKERTHLKHKYIRQNNQEYHGFSIVWRNHGNFGDICFVISSILKLSLGQKPNLLPKKSVTSTYVIGTFHIAQTWSLNVKPRVRGEGSYLLGLDLCYSLIFLWTNLYLFSLGTKGMGAGFLISLILSYPLDPPMDSFSPFRLVTKGMPKMIVPFSALSIRLHMREIPLIIIPEHTYCIFVSYCIGMGVWYGIACSLWQFIRSARVQSICIRNPHSELVEPPLSNKFYEYVNGLLPVI